MTAARDRNILRDFPGIEGEPAVFTAEELQAIAASELEQEVVAFFTPRLGEIVASAAQNLCSELVLVNCEEYRWLGGARTHPSTYEKKPDLLVCHAAYYEAKEESAANPIAKNRRNEDFKFGIASNALRDSVAAVIEAKVRIDAKMNVFGEVINYGRLMCIDLPMTQAAYVLLFDKSCFYLFSFRGGGITSIERSLWTTPGSSKLVRDFFEGNRSIWTQVLDATCSQFGVRPVKGSSFLGYGAYGRVFRVRRQGNESSDLALKIVLDVNYDSLELERDYMTKARSLVPHAIVELDTRPGRKVEGGAGLLLKDVGRRIESRKEYCPRVIQSLASLHCAAITHGDPRLANALIMSRGEIKWIDFMSSRFMETAAVSFRIDMKILIESFFEPNPPPPSVEEALMQYLPASPDELSTAIVAALP